MKYTEAEIDEHRRLFLDALLSGRYKKTTGQLRDNRPDYFCPLGLACEVSQQGEWIENMYRTKTEESFIRLPAEVRWWLGEDSADPLIRWTDETGFVCSGRVSILNDNMFWSFNDIAYGLKRRWYGE